MRRPQRKRLPRGQPKCPEATATTLLRETVRPAESTATTRVTIKATETDLSRATAARAATATVSSATTDAFATVARLDAAERISRAAATSAALEWKRTDSPVVSLAATATSTADDRMIRQPRDEATFTKTPATPLSAVTRTAQAGATDTVQFVTRATVARETAALPHTPTALTPALQSAVATSLTETATSAPIYSGSYRDTAFGDYGCQ